MTVENEGNLLSVTNNNPLIGSIGTSIKSNSDIVSETLELQEKVLKELHDPDFPDLAFLFSEKALGVTEKVLDDLLHKEKKDFQKLLDMKNEEISFDNINSFSFLDYYYGLLSHYKSINGTDTIRKIIENFEPKYIELSNEKSYSKRFYEILIYCYQNLGLGNDEKRILFLSIEKYKARGIDLSELEQKRLKEITQELSMLSMKFGNNLVGCVNIKYRYNTGVFYLYFSFYVYFSYTPNVYR